MANCSIIHHTKPHAVPHGAKNTFLNKSSIRLYSGAKESAIHDHKVFRLNRQTSTDYQSLYDSNTSQMGGANLIECPLTNKTFSINSKKGKKIIKTYIKHFKSNPKDKSCKFCKIKNFKSNRYVSIFGKIGRNILKNYM